MPTVFAAADIGSNTAHLLIAQMGTTGLQRLANESEWLSLGQVVSHDGVIPKDLVSQLVATLQKFKLLASTMRAEGLYVFATEAVRKAENHKEVLRIVKRETGLKVEIVTPRREAELGLKGALLDRMTGGKFAFVESGGGSVQIAVCQGPDIIEEDSLPIGTGVLIDRGPLSQPAASKSVETVRQMIGDALSQLSEVNGVAQILASGGVARGLWRALHPDGDPCLFREELQYLAWSTQHLNTKTIISRYRVKGKRAVTLLPGALIYLALLDRLNVPQMVVSQFGVREGAILELSQGKIVPCPL